MPVPPAAGFVEAPPCDELPAPRPTEAAEEPRDGTPATDARRGSGRRWWLLYCMLSTAGSWMAGDGRGDVAEDAGVITDEDDMVRCGAGELGECSGAAARRACTALTSSRASLGAGAARSRDEVVGGEWELLLRSFGEDLELGGWASGRKPVVGVNSGAFGRRPVAGVYVAPSGGAIINVWGVQGGRLFAGDRMSDSRWACVARGSVRVCRALGAESRQVNARLLAGLSRLRSGLSRLRGPA